MKGPINLFKQRSFGDYLTDTFNLFGKNIKELLVPVLFIAGPFLLIAGALGNEYLNTAFADILNDPADIFELLFSWRYLSILVTTLLGSVLSMLVVYAYVILYEQVAENEPITTMMVWQLVKKHFFKVFLYFILYGIILFFAFLVLFIPGVYLAIACSLLIFVSMRENLGFSDSFKRSMALIKDNWWLVFGLFLIVYICIAVISSIFSFPIGILSMKSAMDGSLGLPAWVKILTGLLNLLSALFNVIIFLLTAVIYYTLLEDKEAPGAMETLSELDKL